MFGFKKKDLEVDKKEFVKVFITTAFAAGLPVQSSAFQLNVLGKYFGVDFTKEVEQVKREGIHDTLDKVGNIIKEEIRHEIGL